MTMSSCLRVRLGLLALVPLWQTLGTARADDTPPTPIAKAAGVRTSPASAARVRPPADDEARASDACSDTLDGRSACLKRYAEKVETACNEQPAGPEARSLVRLSGGDGFRANVCERLCANDPESSVPFCALAHDDVARAAVVLGAWQDVIAIQDFVRAQARMLRKNNAAITRAVDDTLKALEIQVLSTGAAAPDVPEVAAQALQGLAKLIADRAKVEAVGWVLDQLGDNLCPSARPNEVNAPELQKREIARHWLPALCDLAREQRLSSYGAGAGLLEQVRAAIREDLEGWPGAVAGLAPAALYWEDVSHVGLHALSDCRREGLNAEQQEFCSAVDRVRDSTQQSVTRILSGRDPLGAMTELSTQLDTVNTRTFQNGTRQLASPRLELAACSLAAPQRFRSDYDGAEAIGLLDPSARAEAAALAVLIDTTPCWLLTGRGMALPENGAWPSGQLLNPLSTSKPLERISTTFRLRNRLTSHAAALVQGASEVSAATRSLRDALSELENAQKSLVQTRPPVITSLDAGKPGTIADLADAHAGAVSRIVTGPAQARVAVALLRLSRVGLSMAEQTTSLVQSAPQTGPLTLRGQASLVTQIETVRATLRQMGAGVDLATAWVGRDYAKLGTRVLSALRDHPQKNFVGAPRDKLRRYLAVLSAIASARDSDEVARTLEGVAAPAGAWRGKGEAGVQTISITAHAGWFSGREWRYGNYGPHRERGDTHWQLPALAMPVGVELTWGSSRLLGSPFGLFFPLIDPVAFLQYDAEKNGRLPGASLKTALSPGIGARLGLQGSPFSIIPQLVYRPGFRQWDSELSGTGANALQLGVLLGIDVTLFVFDRRGGG